MPTTLTPVTGDVLVSASAAGSQVWPLTLAKPGGGYYVLYSSTKDGPSRIYLQEMTDGGVRVGGEIAVSPGYPAYAFHACVLADGNIAIAWPDTGLYSYIEVVTPTGTVVTAPTLYNIRPTSFDALPGGGFLAGGALHYNGLGDFPGVASFTATGAPDQLALFTGKVSVAESLANGKLLAVTVSGGVMTANFLDPSDLSAGAPLVVSASETAADNVDILQLANGNIVISWIDRTGGQPASLHYRVFDSAMAAVSNDITVADAVNPDRPALINLASGGFLMSWAGDDGAGEGVLAQTFNNAGVASSAIIPVTDTTASGQYAPFNNIVIQLGNGDLAFSWWSWGSTNGDAYTRVLSLDTVSGPFVGTPGADVANGGASADTMSGAGGNDTLYGNGGADILNGDDGNDRLYGGSGDDSLGGGLGADQLFGGDGNDSLNGGDGNDSLDGGAGADAMTGGKGNDVYFVDDAGDQTIELSGEGVDVVRASVSWTLGANLEQLELQGKGDLDGTGNALANRLVGNGGDNLLSGLGGVDTIDGGDGNDTIVGGTGNDLMTGGAGADTFVVLNESVYWSKNPLGKALETDFVYDLNKSEGDKLDLSAVDADAGQAGDQAFHLVGAFTRHSCEMTLVYSAATNQTVLSLDVDGDGRADYQMKITGDVHLDSGGWVL